MAITGIRTRTTTSLRHNTYVNEKANIHVPDKHKNTIRQIRGFYGLIGPNIRVKNNVDSLYDLFMGDGVVQGVFFDNGNLTYVRHVIKTEKVVYEEQHGKLQVHNQFWMAVYMLLHQLRMFPNVMGMANTALFHVKDETRNHTYALFERDYPYLLDIDFAKKDIQTVKKVKIPKLAHFSGHSKIDKDGNIETIDYDLFTRKVKYLLLDKSWNVIDSHVFPFRYFPIIHDFYADEDKVIVIDSPLSLHFLHSKNIRTKIPIWLDRDKPTYIHVYEKKTKTCKVYTVDQGFYTFHYADVKTDDNTNTIDIYISQYDELNFNKVNIVGKYRIIRIDRNTGKVCIHKNEGVENYNLDFPIRFDDKIISRHMEGRKIPGFVITRGLDIVKTIWCKNKHVCGEHNIIRIRGIPYLVFFNVEDDKNKLTFVHLYTYNMFDLDIDGEMTLGFHSIFFAK
jgi:hypothetical protein